MNRQRAEVKAKERWGPTGWANSRYVGYSGRSRITVYEVGDHVDLAGRRGRVKGASYGGYAGAFADADEKAAATVKQGRPISRHMEELLLDMTLGGLTLRTIPFDFVLYRGSGRVRNVKWGTANALRERGMIETLPVSNGSRPWRVTDLGLAAVRLKVGGQT